MKRCLNCHTISKFNFENCSSCNSPNHIIDGFLAFSPNMANDGDGFKIESFPQLANLEDHNFWFNSRNKLIKWLIKFFNPNFDTFLEIGCGTGFVLNAIQKEFSSRKFFGSELFVEGLKFAHQRLPMTTFMQMDARNIPFVNEFDSIGLFDVLEHISEDELVLRNIFDALKSKGFIFITVPQHQWLWSKSDELACHVKRYHVKDLTEKLNKVGFEIVFSTSFVFFLLPLMFISRWFQANKKNIEPIDEFQIPKFLNMIFEKILNIEIFLIKKGITFPIGGSRVIVARKI